ncbi:MAG: HAD family hydrolase [Bacteroidales bacterium]|nr:HAD family hydrolase [Bacteroidales bacterium]
MNHIDNLKGVIFDYGGTIDSRGVHWSEVIWDGYCDAGVAVTKEQFRECYVFAERELAKVRHILPHHNFHDLLLIKMRIELGYLAGQGLLNADCIEPLAEKIALYCYRAARSSVEEARPVLEALYARYPMVLVSNFYGNVESVLADFDLRRYFRDIIESAVVGVRKPDPKIFQLGVDALGLKPEEVLVIGDSYKKDIVPAESIGCHVAWIKGKGWTADEDAQMHPNIIKNLREILDVAL